MMVDAMKNRGMKIEDHARTLEKRVKERTADLVAAMENYRTLVENVPLIVYRLLQDGTTEFINPYLTENLGYTIEEAVGDKKFWQEKIFGNDLKAYNEFIITCFRNGKRSRRERLVRHKNGDLLAFIDHAIPATDENGSVKWVDGIMMDISQLKKLQERALRTEEIRTLGEISARIAHEIRNPLVMVGGFARRLHDSLPEHDPQKKSTGIIVKEVARMERFLKILFSSIRPFDLSLTNVDVNGLLRSWLMELEDSLKYKGMDVVEELSPDIPKIRADEERLNQAFENLIKHAIVSMPEGEMLFISTKQKGDHLIVTFRHRVEHLSDEDLDQFFFPHMEEGGERTILDLPLSKIIIHRHGGKVDVSRGGDHVLIMNIELPIEFTEEDRE